MKNKMPHTPGPWTCGETYGRPPKVMVCSPVVPICMVGNVNVNQEGVEANARLIAAAPELLANLQDLIKCLRAGQLGDISPLMDEIFDSEAAIAKAAGDQR